MDELVAAQQHQARCQDEVKSSRESHDMALMGLKETMSKLTTLAKYLTLRSVVWRI